MNKEKKRAKWPIILGFITGLVLAVLGFTGRLTPLVQSVTAFFESGPKTGPMIWIVLLAALLAIGAYSTKKK